MNKTQALEKGDKVAIVSLSSGILGQPFCKHQIKLGVKRLEELGFQPILYNINFGHAAPRCALPYGALVEVDMESKQIIFKEDWFV